MNITYTAEIDHTNNTERTQKEHSGNTEIAQIILRYYTQR
jgi:hypothetical protein